MLDSPLYRKDGFKILRETGKCTFEVRGVEPQNYPALEIYADGTFRFTANLLNYLGHFSFSGA